MSYSNEDDDVQTCNGTKQSIQQWWKGLDWVDLTLQQNFNGRVENVQIIDISRMRVGKNILTNRLSVINNKIDYKWLNLSKDTFKIKCKDLFLRWTNCQMMMPKIYDSLNDSSLTSRLTLIINTIEYDWLNLTFDSKDLFLIWYFELKHSVQTELNNNINYIQMTIS